MFKIFVFDKTRHKIKLFRNKNTKKNQRLGNPVHCTFVYAMNVLH